MDKLKIFLAVVKKHQFWGLCGLMLLISLACWWLAIGDLVVQFQVQKSKIDGSFNSIKVQSGHPNQEVIKYIRDHNESLQKNVLAAWEILYNEQKKKNPFPTKALREDFKKQFENLKPNESLKRHYRERYQDNFIKGYLPTLRKMIDVRQPKEGKNDEWTGVVDWDEGDYERLRERFDWPETPSTLAVVLAQEDLWVYEALLRAIKNVNEGVVNQADAAVKRIEALEIGKNAVAAAGGSQAGRSSNEQSVRQLIDSRYVDDKGQPLPYASAEYPYVKHPYPEFKMMPIRMKLTIGQRQLPKLLVECANSNMPIEVRCVHIFNPDAAAPAARDPAGRGKERPARPSGRRAGRKTSGQSPETETFDIPLDVEIQAVIYIYHSPNRETLSAGTASGQPPSKATAPTRPPRPARPARSRRR